MAAEVPSSSYKEKKTKEKKTNSTPSQGRAAISGLANLFAWWYPLAAPIDPPPNASFAQQELARKGRLTSIILLFMLIGTGAFRPLALASINSLLTPMILMVLAFCCIAIILNRRGKVTTAGLLATVVIGLAIKLNLLTAPHGILTTNGLLSYDLLVIPELIVVSVLPAGVFVIAIINIAFISIDLTLQPHAADLQHILSASSYTVFIRPIALQVIVALVSYLWVYSATNAIKRAGRAEVVAGLQRSLAEQKRELEFGIQQIQQALVQAANGNFTVRAPLAQENVLWQVAASLNTLLARLQRSSQFEQELQHIRTELGQIVRDLYDAESNQQPIHLHISLSGTLLDPLTQRLNGRYLTQSPGIKGRQRPRQ